MAWKCEECGATNGPEVVYCPECGEAGPEISARTASEINPVPADIVRSEPACVSARDGRDTLVGSSSGIAPSLLEQDLDLALVQPIPRKVRMSVTGWTALVGGWPELSVCTGGALLVGATAFLVARPNCGPALALLPASFAAIFVVLALICGAGDTARTIQGYRLARSGWAAGGELASKSTRKSALGPVYLVEYTFLDSRGVRRRGRQEVTRAEWDGLQQRAPVTVLYDPDRPEHSTIYELLGIFAVEPPRPGSGTTPALADPDDA